MANTTNVASESFKGGGEERIQFTLGKKEDCFNQHRKQDEAF